jgi:hypothetical protein
MGEREDSYPSQDSTRFYHTTQNDMQLKTYELFLEFSYLTFSFHIQLQENETKDNDIHEIIMLIWNIQNKNKIHSFHAFPLWFY